MLVFGSMGYLAIGLLFKLPAMPNCPEMFLPTASASMRLYCADLAASKQTVGSLIYAIKLVNSLPSSHPLRPEIDRHITQWVQDILRLAETSFQSGEFDEAIGAARMIPREIPQSQTVSKRIERWQSIWNKAEKIYQEAEQRMRQAKWHQAFLSAVRLTHLDNGYWATTKYEELIGLLQQAKDDSEKLFLAGTFLKKGGLDNIEAAIKLAEAINSQFVAKKAEALLVNGGHQILHLALVWLERRSWQDVIKLAKKIPVRANLQAEVQDLNVLASAQEKASTGTIPALETAMVLASNLDAKRPLYNKAQQFIASWQLEISDVAHLNTARELAAPRGVLDLEKAIAEAMLIPANNPRAIEAASLIAGWRRQIEVIVDQPFIDNAISLAGAGTPEALTAAIVEISRIQVGRVLYPQAKAKIQEWKQKIEQLEDQPLLDLASQMASYETPESLWDAIAEVSQIRPGRVLYLQARAKIQKWTDLMQRLEDQPVLDRARIQAQDGNFNDAIAIARQIQSRRALFQEADASIKAWKQERQAGEILRAAYQLASAGTPEALWAAIRSALRVQTNAKGRDDAKIAINNWSNQLLVMAQQLAVSDPQGAIAIAKSIPAGVDASPVAQAQIQEWLSGGAISTPYTF
jgi:hypothetical protein